MNDFPFQPRPPFQSRSRHRHGGFGGGPFFGPPPPFRRGRRGGHGPQGRMPRGNIRLAILLLLKERPMHGYEIISELESRSNGLWRPSPGSIYPTLALLEDEGLVSAAESEGKRRFSLTEAGAAHVAERGDVRPPWETIAEAADPSEVGLRESAMLLLGAAAQVARAGTPAQGAEAITILDETRRRLYALLGEPSSS